MGESYTRFFIAIHSMYRTLSGICAIECSPSSRRQDNRSRLARLLSVVTGSANKRGVHKCAKEKGLLANGKVAVQLRQLIHRLMSAMRSGSAKYTEMRSKPLISFLPLMNPSPASPRGGRLRSRRGVAGKGLHGRRTHSMHQACLRKTLAMHSDKHFPWAALNQSAGFSPGEIASRERVEVDAVRKATVRTLGKLGLVRKPGRLGRLGSLGPEY
jgi:hypothetical protein